MSFNPNIIFIIPIFFNLLIILFFNKICDFLNVFDLPDNVRKFHKKKIPLVGGFIFFLNFTLIILLDLYLNNSASLSLLKFFYKREIFMLIIVSLLIFAIGYYDDKSNLEPLRRLLLIILCIYLFLVFSETTRINSINIKLYDFNYKYILREENFVFTLFCILVLINILNFFDGINLQLIFYSILIFIYLYFKTNINLFLILIIPLIFLGYYNYKNKLFLGDSGAYLLAFIISIFLINSHNIGFIENSFEVFALFSLPFFDSLRIIYYRVKFKKKFYEGDYSHFHHILIQVFGLKKSEFLICLINFLLISIVFFDYLLAIILSLILIIIANYFSKKNKKN